jgi:hypothetical protein
LAGLFALFNALESFVINVGSGPIDWLTDRSLTRRLGIAIGHTDNYGFLKTQYIAHVLREFAEHGKFGGAWVAEHRIDAKVSHHTDEGFSHSRTVGSLVGHKLSVFGLNG